MGACGCGCVGVDVCMCLNVEASIMDRRPQALLT